MVGRAGYLFLFALTALSMVEVFVKVPAHSEDEHDADEFRKEFGDEPQHDSFSQGTKDDHVELREGPQFTDVKPKTLRGKQLPTLRFMYCGRLQDPLAVQDRRCARGNNPPICLLSIVYKLFTRVILNRISKTLDEGQPCEKAGFRRVFSTIDHIHTITKLIEVSREYKLPLCLTYIDLKKAFDSVEIEAVMEALCLTFIDLKKAFDSVETEAVMEALLIALRS
ncbi:unnamed protein product [Heligmosomoides polygyrus]|uniref:Reverse transcriptase domain-containing protein n=1 Tax=Heligmosomoides polygyrus TaxID=6339 RepID=A0A183FUU3_HELPZ|nr:unnamed protein product [Heligmosomoides polygyrus]